MERALRDADPEFERITIQRAKKELQRVEHTGRVSFANLQRFFFLRAAE